MDEIVLQAMAKWPNVPDCFGWLALDARGRWWMRDDRSQTIGSFAAACVGRAPRAAKGSRLEHDKLIAFIGRNYGCDTDGRWYFQNGPQRVFVELEVTPWVMRVDKECGGYSLRTHTGRPARLQRVWTDDVGHVYAETDVGVGIIHTQDVGLAADALEHGLWVPHELGVASLPDRFGFVASPAASAKTGNP